MTDSSGICVSDNDTQNQEHEIKSAAIFIQQQHLQAVIKMCSTKRIDTEATCINTAF